MPIVVNNNFSEDSYGMRSERLSAIQGNFDSIQSELAAPAAIATWAEDCYDVYAELWTNAGVENDQSEAATLDLNVKLALMEDEYQNAKFLATSIYRENQTFLKQFEFDMRFPDLRNDKIDKARKVLKTHENHVAALVTTLLPTAIITRLTNAVEAAEAAKWAQDKERGESGHALDLLTARFDSDTGFLQELRAWWYAMLGKKDARITWVGMVNPQTGGGGKVPDAPTNLQYDQITGRISWESTPEATSYKVEISFESGEYEEQYAGSDLETYYIPPSSPSSFIIHTMGRNSSGLGPVASLTVNYDPPLQPPDYMSLTVTNPSLRTIAINWGDSVGANAYRLFHSAVALSAPQGEFSLVGEYAGTSYSGSVDAATRNYFYVVAVKGEETSAPSDVGYIDML